LLNSVIPLYTSYELSYILIVFFLANKAVSKKETKILSLFSIISLYITEILQAIDLEMMNREF
jgi:hypothetical protein